VEVPSRELLPILGTGYGRVKKIRFFSRASQLREILCFLIDWPVNCPILVHVLLLAADTSSPSGSVAVLRGDSVVALIHTVSDEAYSSRLFRHLDFILRDLSLELKGFDALAVASGPGSFTGLRVGLAAAKAWSEAFSRPVAGISALHAVAAQCRSSSPIVVPVIDARRQQLYYAFYRNTSSGHVLEGDEKVADPQEFLEGLSRLPGDQTFTVVSTDGELLEKLFSDAKSAGMSRERVSPALAPWIGRIALAQARSGNLGDSLSLDANYVRRSDAELHWKGA